MASVIPLSRRYLSGRRSITQTERAAAEAERVAAEERRSIIVLVVSFSVAALTMSIAVVLAATNSWAVAIPLIACIVVFALLKIVLADALFFVMLRADKHTEAAEAAKPRPAGLVVRRPPPSRSRRPNPLAAVPRRGFSPVSPLRRSPLSSPSRRTDR